MNCKRKRIVTYGYYKNKITVSIKEDPVEWRRQWTFFNKERKKELDFKNKDHINELRRKRRKTPEGAALLATYNSTYNKKHRKKLTEKYLERRKKDPAFKILTILRGRIRQALKGYNKSNLTVKLLGCRIEEFWIHLEKKFTKDMTRENHGEWHVDHIIPCASFDLSKPEEQAKCFHYTNLQPLWAMDNLKKGDRKWNIQKYYQK
ncbi:MAG: hypothetical protein H8E55_61010 [Pelagibacterales bacterium]|nr:hypothetical protein [Pelagibacterales bacterium]